MPLRIRCPHCKEVMVVQDELAGQRTVCSACTQVFSVPLPREAIEATSAASVQQRTCPKCEAEVGPTAAFCHNCHLDFETGKRLPLRRRLRLFSWRFWAATASFVVILGLGTVVGLQVYQARSAPEGRSGFDPTAPREIPTEKLAQALLDARTVADRVAALRDMNGVEARTAPAVAAALERSLADRTHGLEVNRSRIAAIDLLIRTVDEHPDQRQRWQTIVADAAAFTELRPVAVAARGALGDLEATEELAQLWLDQQRHRLAIEAVIAAAGEGDAPAARVVLDQLESEIDRSSHGLRTLAARNELRVFEPLVEAYWDSWQWLGQEEGDRLGKAIFELARPMATSLEFQPEDVRTPRDLLKRLGASGSPSARAAAAIILDQRGPQYQRVCRVITDSLADILPDCNARDQQRLTWTISRLRGKLFGRSQRTRPTDVTDEEIRSALDWAGHDASETARSSYPTTPRLVYRAVPADRLLERDLLEEMRRGWSSARIAYDQWVAADIGMTDRLRAILDPGQREPERPALVMAMVLAARYNAQDIRDELALWRMATDQPVWLRELAYTAEGALDARRGRWRSDWPAGLSLGESESLATGRPVYELFAMLIAAGGQPAIERFEQTKTPEIPPDVRAQLLDAARSTLLSEF